jgi:hypothetical protein
MTQVWACGRQCGRCKRDLCPWHCVQGPRLVLGDPRRWRRKLGHRRILEASPRSCALRDHHLQGIDRLIWSGNIHSCIRIRVQTYCCLRTLERREMDSKVCKIKPFAFQNRRYETKIVNESANLSWEWNTFVHSYSSINILLFEDFRNSKIGALN